MEKIKLLELNVEQLLDMLHPDFRIGKTFFDDPKKAYWISHVYDLLAEINTDEEEEDYQTFGYAHESITQAKKVGVVYGSTAKRCLIEFFEIYPHYCKE